MIVLAPLHVEIYSRGVLFFILLIIWLQPYSLSIAYKFNECLVDVRQLVGNIWGTFSPAFDYV